ncbi:MAG TPA: type III polyketide synthase [Acidimicrobiales bacterium]|nr:type III polyketide synthase [Acidimicrobiales bacterium]
MSTAAVLTGAAHAFPASERQSDLFDGFFDAHFGHRRAARAAFDAVGVERRHAVVNPLAEDVSSWTTGARMARYVVEAVPLAKEALSGAIGASSVSARDLGLLVVASCTGYATPGIDVRLAQDLDLAADLQRLLLGHVGCHAALPGLAAARDYVALHGRAAALVCIELTSLHVQPPTRDLEQVVIHALFGDAASALVLEPGAGSGSGARAIRTGRALAPPLEVLEIESCTASEAAGLMTWEITDLGFRMGLSRHVPEVVGRRLGPLVDGLLGRHGVRRSDVAAWAVHPGGPRVLDVVADRLSLSAAQLAPSRSVLAQHGNCSSATLPIVLDRVRGDVRPGELVVAVTFGPGLTLCACLLRGVDG